MNTREFLEILLPDSGWIIVATPFSTGNGFDNKPYQKLDDATATLTKWAFAHKASYFGLATYKADQEWDPTYKDRKTGETVGKFRVRTQTNAMLLKSFFLDLDVGAEEDKFNSKLEAMTEFRAFQQQVGLPEPMIVDSGGGYHIYWPLEHPVTTALWRPVADTFKNICLSTGFKADRSLTSDQARVLRALGTPNARRGEMVKLVQRHPKPITFESFKGALDAFVANTGLSIPRARPVAGSTALAAGGSSALFGDGNLGATNDPINFDRITFHCAQIGTQVAQRGAHAGEKLWRAALGIAKFAEPQNLAYRAVSDGHPDYDEGRTIIKIANWSTPPSSCEMFHQENPLTCESCREWGKIKSPAVLGRMTVEGPAPVVTIVNPVTGQQEVVTVVGLPKHYKRRKDGAILMDQEDDDGKLEAVVICPIDFYPISILRQHGTDSKIRERSLWRAHLDRLGPTDIDVEQAMISDTRKLAGFLFEKGLYLNDDQAKATKFYMTAYLQKLAAENDRSKLYEHMGWNDGRKEFALADAVIHRDGTMTPTQPSRAVRAVTREGMKTVGTLDGWKKAVKFYAEPQYAGHRMFLYASFGSPIFHMNDTGNKGVILSASGASGRGKTTCLMACASVWGEPQSLIMNANRDGSTVNAMYEALGAYHSLPFLWDDATERESEDMKKLLLNVSQGEGKMRMKDGSGLNERRLSWELMMLMTSNIDERARTMASGKEVDPHLMRLVGVEFSLVDTDAAAKAKAENFIRAIKGNYGHAGPLFMQAVMTNYDKVQTKYINNVSKVDRLVGSANASAERFWTAAVAACYTGASLAKHVGILPAEFDIEADLAWMVSHLQKQRVAITESRQSPMEIFAEFLESALTNTLTISGKLSGNLDNVVNRPHGALWIRHNLDLQTMHVARAAFMEYCKEHKASFKSIEDELTTMGVVTDNRKLKVLGADTPYAKGQTRCWVIDAKKLGPVQAATTASQGANNVVSIGSKAA